MSQWTPYTKTQVFSDGKVIVESAGTGEVSLEDEFQDLEDKLGAIPAVATTGNLTLRGGLDFNALYGITGLRSINTAIFSVRGYGAVGDGTTDDASAFQTAINDASAAGGGIILVEPTTASYKIGSTLSLVSKKHITFLGVRGSPGNSGGSTLSMGTTSTPMFDCGSTISTRAQNITWNGIRFASTTSVSAGAPYFITDLGSHCRIEKCLFESSNTAIGGAFEAVNDTDAAMLDGLVVEDTWVTGRPSN